MTMNRNPRMYALIAHIPYLLVLFCSRSRTSLGSHLAHDIVICKSNILNLMSRASIFLQPFDAAFRRIACQSRSFLECDGAILVSSEAIEHDGIQAWRDWFAETNRHIFVFYPHEPPNPKAEVVSTPGPEITEDGDAHSDEITEFLGRAMNVHGERSVVYVSHSKA